MVVGLICSLIPTQLLLTWTNIPSSSFCCTNYCSDISSSALLSFAPSHLLFVLLTKAFQKTIQSIKQSFSFYIQFMTSKPNDDEENFTASQAILWTVDLRTNRTCKTLVRDIVVWNRVRINPYLVYGRRTRYIIGKEKTWRQKRKRYRNFSLSDILKLLETTTENKTKKMSWFNWIIIKEN